MGTTLEDVLIDIDALKEHLEYLATCRGTKGLEASILSQIEQLKILAKLINKKE
jgi:hypothetical protein